MKRFEANRNSRTVSAVVVDGPGKGYRCIAGSDGFFWESFSTEETECRRLRENLLSTEQTGLHDSVFYEVLGRRPELVLCGGGHVAAAVLRLAQFLQMPVTVIEDRPHFADQARTAGAVQVICDSFEHALEGIQGGPDVYFVIMTRGHRHDKVCLESILRKPYAYVGMMGSRSRVRLLKETLLEEGFSAKEVEDLHAPIGLDIGSETPEEIAVSVMGEIISVKNRDQRTAIFPDEIRESLLRPEKKVLATIVSRKGSAPRQVGTKMVIFRDGHTAGTIGGGCMEAEVITQALALMRETEEPEFMPDQQEEALSRTKLLRLDMTSQDAEEEGMVCGGMQDVFLEVLNCCQFIKFI